MEEDVEIEMLLQKHGITLEKAAANELEYASENEGIPARARKSSFEDKELDTAEGNNYQDFFDDGHHSVSSLKNTDSEYLEYFSSDEEDKLYILDKTENDSLSESNRTRKNKTSLKRVHKIQTRKRKHIDSGDESDDLQDTLDKEILSLTVRDFKRNLENPDQSYEDQRAEERELMQLLSLKEPMCNTSFEPIQSQAEELPFQLENKTTDEFIALEEKAAEREACYEKILEKLKESLIECQENLKMAGEFKDSGATSSNVRESGIEKCFYKKFGMPYFEDSKGFTPPPNDDTKKKIQNGELIVSNIPKMRYWTQHHKEMLEDAIKKTIVDEHKEKLLKRIEKLQEYLKTVVDKTKKEEVNNQIVEYKNEILKLEIKSYSELVSKENPDREYDWLKYSATVFNGAHSSEECSRFWHVYLKPSINRAVWGMDEDIKLVEIAEKMNYQNWSAIAEMLGTNRTAYQCFVHHQSRIHERTGLSSGKWSKEEDELLITVIKASRIGNFIPWSKVSSHFYNRTHTQIYNRWNNCLNPSLVKGKFSKDEDLLIISGIEVFGASYKEMASLLSNRTSTQVRERYERYLQPKSTKTGTWSLDEDNQLMELFKLHGNNWRKISEIMKTRTRTQVRQRHAFISQMMETKPGWAPDKVKRRNIQNVDKSLKRTENLVKKVKEEVDIVEKTFKLSELERNLFKIEKLKELRDKIVNKKYDRKRKKSAKCERSDETAAKLTNFFLTHDPKKSDHTIKVCQTVKPGKGFLNQILILANYFGHEIKLPDCEREVMESDILKSNQKTFLLETLGLGSKHTECEIIEVSNTETEIGENSVEGMSCLEILTNTSNTPSQTSSSNIDYEEPETDESLYMMDWWHTAPVNIKNLNFGEFFKPTVYDYSYGMHKEIWEAKLSRSQRLHIHQIEFLDEDEVKPSTAKSSDQPLFIPPNLLTCIGLKTLLLTRSRLKQLAKSTNQDIYSHENTVGIKSDLSNLNLKYNLLDKFQETMISLFTWPRISSQTSLGSTPWQPSNIVTFDKRIDVFHQKNIVKLLDKTDCEPTENVRVSCKAPVKVVQRKTLEVLKPHILTQKRALSNLRKGINPRRKMKVEHLVKKLKPVKTNERKNTSCKIKRNFKQWEPATSTPSTVTESQVSCVERKRGRRRRKSSQENEREVEEGIYDHLPFQTPKVTYSRISKNLKSPSVGKKTSTGLPAKFCDKSIVVQEVLSLPIIN